MVYDSGFMNGFGSEEARVKAAEYIKEKGIGDTVRRYHLQDWIFSRQHYWGEPIPIVHCPKCGDVAVPEDQLPLELPYVEKYEPTDTGESPLATMTDWVNTKCPKCGGDAKRETDVMPNWAGSSWYFTRYADPHNTKAIASPELMKYWMPVDLYEGGQEHVTLHLLYSRFWHKFLYDQGIVPTPEPYQKRTIHGMVLGEGGVKMSKSLGNVISPDDLIAKYGADVTRAYMMFMGPYEGDVVWSAETINGVKRFVSKYYDFILNAWDNKQNESDEAAHKAIAKLLKRIEENLLSLKFNTSISALMEFYNEFSKNTFCKEDIEKLVVVIAPSLPHMAEELWNLIGHADSVHVQQWPNIDKKLLVENTLEVPIQINGKVRGRITISTTDTENLIREKVLSDKALLAHLNGGEIKKFIYVPNKIINVVV
jgi:leucyl-tRNA synthetase